MDLLDTDSPRNALKFNMSKREIQNKGGKLSPKFNVGGEGAYSHFIFYDPSLFARFLRDIFSISYKMRKKGSEHKR